MSKSYLNLGYLSQYIQREKEVLWYIYRFKGVLKGTGSVNKCNYKKLLTDVINRECFF